MAGFFETGMNRIMDSPVTKPWNTAKFCNIAGALRWQAERQPGTIAVHHPGKRNIGPGKSSSYSYLELNELTVAYARGMEELGISRGDRVYVQAENSIAFPVIFTALARLGAVPVVAAQGISTDASKFIFEKTTPKAFVGSPSAHLATKLRNLANQECSIAVSTGHAIPGVAMGLKAVYSLGMKEARDVFHNSSPDEMAAISCAAPQGNDPVLVMHTHGELAAKAEAIQEAFAIAPGEVGLTSDPMISIFDAALGIESVFVDINSANPGPSDAKRLVKAIEEHEVSNVFLSAAMLEAFSHQAQEQNANLPLVRRLITLDGSPRVETIARLEKAVHIEAQIHTPYGRAECFPVSSISNHNIDSELEEMMESGEGVCVGRPVDSVDVRIIAPSDKPYESLNSTPVLPPGLVGEIIVSARHCSAGHPGAGSDKNKIPDDEEEPGTGWATSVQSMAQAACGIAAGILSASIRARKAFTRNRQRPIQPTPRCPPHGAGRGRTSGQADAGPVRGTAA